MAPAEIDLLNIARGLVIAPAGCGKTQLIADALVRHAGSKPVLILTHTNAGVVALRARLDKAGGKALLLSAFNNRRLGDPPYYVIPHTGRSRSGHRDRRAAQLPRHPRSGGKSLKKQAYQ